MHNTPRRRRRKSDLHVQQIVRQAQRDQLDEWVQRQYNRVGRWTIRGIGTALFYLVMWVIFHFVTIRVGNYNLLDMLGEEYFKDPPAIYGSLPEPKELGQHEHLEQQDHQEQELKERAAH